MAPSPQLVQKRNELAARQASLKAALGSIRSGEGHDFSKLEKIGEKSLSELSLGDRAKEFGKYVDETNDLGKEVDALAEADQKARTLDEDAKRASDDGSFLPGTDRAKAYDTFLQMVEQIEKGEQGITLGSVVCGSDLYKKFKSGGRAAQEGLVKGWTLQDTINGVKAVTWPSPASPVYLPGVVEAPDRMLTALEMLPKGRVTGDLLYWNLQTARITQAAARAAGAAYAEGTYTVARQTSPVQAIGVHTAVNDETFEDESMFQSELDGDLMHGVRRTIETQALTGNGTAPNLQGILTATGIQTKAKGSAVSRLDIVSEAIAAVYTTGDAMASHILMNPNDWHQTRILKGNDQYFLGSPGMAIRPMIWGVPVVQSQAVTAATVYVGDFQRYAMLYERLGGVEIAVGLAGTNFTDGQKTVRARHRVVAINRRPKAFYSITTYNS